MNYILKSLKTLFRELTKRPRHYELPARVNYHENWLLPPLAIFVGIYIVLYGHHRSFGEAMLMLDFYKAAIPSILSGWVVMWCIVRLTYVLDEQYPWTLAWYRGPLTRVVLQLCGGVIMPGFFIFGVFAIYFLVRGHAGRIIRYLLEDFPFVLLMFLGFNVLLWFFYRLRNREMMQKFQEWKRRYGKSIKEMEAKRRASPEVSESFLDRMQREVALFEPGRQGEEKGTWALHFDNTRAVELQSIDSLERQLGGPHFCMAYRATLINRAAIREVHDVHGKAEAVLLDSLGGRVIEVSRRYRVRFLEWWRGEGNSGTKG